jgi:hypothetical protein
MNNRFAVAAARDNVAIPSGARTSHGPPAKDFQRLARKEPLLAIPAWLPPGRQTKPQTGASGEAAIGPLSLPSQTNAQA